MKCSCSCSFDGLFGKWYLMDEYSIQNTVDNTRVHESSAVSSTINKFQQYEKASCYSSFSHCSWIIFR